MATLSLFVKKIGETFSLGEFADLPAVSQNYLIQYGVDQSGTDCHASITRNGKTPFTGTDEEFKAAVRKEVTEWVAKIKSGQLRGRVTEDPKVVARRELGRAIGRELSEAEYDVIVQGATKVLKAAAKAA
jgi:hypothetical protein